MLTKRVDKNGKVNIIKLKGTHFVSESGIERGDNMTGKTPGQKLRELRAGVPMAVVADEVGVTKAALSNYENDIRIPRHDTMGKLAAYYKTTVDAIFF